MDNEKYQALLEKYLKGECTDQEIAALDAWYDAMGKNMENKGSNTEGVEKEKILLEKNWAALQSKMVDEPIVLKPIRTWRYWLAAASVLLLVSVGGYWFFNNKKDNQQAEIAVSESKKTPLKIIEKRNTSAEILRLELSDRSVVSLKPNSVLRYAETFEGNLREVTLDGEAFFDVAKNPEKPFLVYSNDVVTKVLGTSFNVKMNHKTGNVAIDVRTGKVAVFSKKVVNSDTVKVVLTPNQRAEYILAKNQLVKSLVEKPVVLIEKAELKKFTFNNAPIEQVFAAIEKAYGVEISYDKNVMKDCTMTTSLEDENLYDKLNIVCKLLGATFKPVDTQIVIKGVSCQ